MRKHRILAPDSWGADQRNDSREPRLLHLPIHRKELNSLTWGIWFSLINSNLLMFQLPGVCCKKSYIFWLPLCLVGAISQSDWRCSVPSLRTQFCPSFIWRFENYVLLHNSQLLGCAFFFSRQILSKERYYLDLYFRKIFWVAVQVQLDHVSDYEWLGIWHPSPGICPMGC